jgi:hypothetical protein
MDVVDDDEPFGDELIELRQERIDSFGFVDDQHDKGQIVRQAQDPRGVESVGGPESFDTSHNRRTGKTGLLGAVHDLGRERVMVVPVALADEDRQSARFTFQTHEVLLVTEVLYRRRMA